MASRMDRYHDREERSSRNESLYRSIENLDNYSNIEGVVEIDKTNEIDLSRVKALIQSREGYQQEKKYRQLVSEEKETEEPTAIEEEEERTYDIRDVLTKAKETRPEQEEDYRSLKNTSYDIVERLNLKRPTVEEAEALKELIDTITIHESKELVTPPTEDGGLLDELKSDTMVGDAGSIKKIIDEAKQEEEKQEEEKRLDNTNLENIDTTFYTSSMGFTDSDFEDLKNLEANIKKHNILLRIVLVGIVLIGIGLIITLIVHFMN